MSFLEGGGTVLLADDYGSGNSLLQNLNVKARFAGKPLADLYFYSKAPSFPIITDFTPNPVTRNLTSVIMDHPTYLEILDPTTLTVLALSSPFSFIDSLNNGTLPLNESTQSYPVIASSPVGKGLLVLVANAYAFTNEMIGLYDNRLLFSNLLKAANGTVAFDLAHLKKAPLTDYRIAFRNALGTWVTSLNSTIAQLALTATLVAVFGAIFIRRWTVDRHRERSGPWESTLHSNAP